MDQSGCCGLKDKYKAMWTADIHMNNNLPHSRPLSNGRTDRMLDQIKLWEKFGSIAEFYDIDDFWILGDLFDHGRVDAVTLAETANVMSRFQGNLFLLPGNHDAHSIQGKRFNLEAFGLLSDKISYLGGNPVKPVVKAPWLVFWPVEFMSVQDTMRAVNDVRERIRDDIPKTSGERVDVLLIHNAIVGCQHAGWSCDSGLDAGELCEGFDHVLSGHFHDHQYFGDRGFYLGSPMHHRFDDEGRESGFWLLEFSSNGSLSKTFFESETPSFYEREWGSELDSLLDSNALSKGDYLRIRVSCTHAEWSKKRNKIFEFINDIERKLSIRASFMHKPTYHHSSRFRDIDDSSEKNLSIRSGIAKYVSSDEVDTKGLDKSRLVEIGMNTLKIAREGK